MFTPFPPDLHSDHHRRPKNTSQQPLPEEQVLNSAIPPTVTTSPPPQQQTSPTRKEQSGQFFGGHKGDESRLTLSTQSSRVSGRSVETFSSSSSNSSHLQMSTIPSTNGMDSKPPYSSSASPAGMEGSSRHASSSKPRPKGRGGMGSSSTGVTASLSMALQGVKSRSRPGTPNTPNGSSSSGSLAFGSREASGTFPSSAHGTGSSRIKKARSSSRTVSHSTHAFSWQRAAAPVVSPRLDSNEGSSSGAFGNSESNFFDRRKSWESLSGKAARDSSSSLMSESMWATIKPAYDEESDEPSDARHLKHQPLPVRLGLVPAFPTEKAEVDETSDHASYVRAPQKYRSDPGLAGSRYVDGYYLHTPPPQRTEKPYNQSSNTISTAVSESSSHSHSSDSPNGHISPRYEQEHQSGDQGIRQVSGRRPGPHILQPKPRTKPVSEMKNNTADTSTADDVLTGPLKGDSHTSSHADRSTSNPWQLQHYWHEEEYTTEFGGVRKTRTHAFPRSRVPYFLSHDIDAMAAEMDLHNMAYEILSHRHSVYPFEQEQKPKRVLDIGTGCGAWCIDIARSWSETEVVGLDVVPCQTPTSYLKDADLERRISWVVANFLEELPFPSDSFDFIHMRFIGSCALREDQWGDFLTEVARVLKPTGQMELIESNWTFLGNIHMTPISDLVKITTGKSLDSRSANQQPSVPQLDKKFAAIEDAFDRMLGRRFINPKATSMIPNAMMSADLKDIRTGRPRVLPLMADALEQDALLTLGQDKASDQGGGAHTSQNIPFDQENWNNRYVTRSQIGTPLENSGFAPRDLPVLRALILSGVSGKLWSSRHLLWDEAEEEKMTLLSNSVGPQGNGRPRASSACWAHPWRSRADFARDIASYRKELVSRAGIGDLLKSLLGWREGNLESIEESRFAEKKRKMSVGIKTTLGIDFDEDGDDLDEDVVHSRVPSSGGYSPSRRDANEDSHDDSSDNMKRDTALRQAGLGIEMQDGPNVDSTGRAAEQSEATAVRDVPGGSPTLCSTHPSDTSLRTAFSSTTAGTDNSEASTQVDTSTSTTVSTPGATSVGLAPQESERLKGSAAQDENISTPAKANAVDAGFTNPTPLPAYPSVLRQQTRPRSHSQPHSRVRQQSSTSTLDQMQAGPPKDHVRDNFAVLGFAEFAGYLARATAQ
ncbi:unnamed protein product [Sympodiomycopsis kandeliae]